ncbi:MAG TPA: SpoIIE family protein phosphatase, partial [Acidimicrobiales bacterium]|nr:SpoIIE family protein phosphatase [Acidimicrobiales bacterium]
MTDLDVTTEAEVARVRRAVRELLTGAPEDMSYAAQLTASELTTNALLHGGGAAHVSIRDVPDGVRIAVRDSSDEVPLLSLPTAESMTGRGLALVANLVSRWGVEAVPGGKLVWAEVTLGGVAEAGPELVIDPTLADPRDEPLVDVVVGDVPTDLLVAAKRHVDNLVREFALAAGGDRAGTTKPVPAPLAQLVEQVVDRFAVARLAIKRLATEAAHAGEPRTALRLHLPVSVADAAVDYVDALDSLDAYSRANRLLTLETPPQHRVFRRWYVGEIVKQLRAAGRGEPPPDPVSLEQCLLGEVDAAEKARQAAERAARLYAVAVALSSAMTPEQASEAVLHEGVAALGASGGGLLLATAADRLALTGAVGYDEAVVAKLRDEPRDAELPAAYALRTGEAVWLETLEERDARFPHLRGLEPDTVAMCAVPVTSGDAVLGALRFSFSSRRLFDSDEQQFVLALAAETAEALQRAELLRLETAARERVLAQTRRLRRLTGLAVEMNRASDVERLLDIVVDGVRDIVGGPSAQCAIVAEDRPRSDAPTMTIPLLAPDGERLALLELRRPNEDFTDDDEAAAAQLAEIASSALYRSMLHEERRRVAVALQQSLLPPTMPSIPGVEVAAEYRPGSELVGGDFYDVFPVGDAGWGVVIGDVRGKGPDAAAVTALVRHSTRTAALLKGRPGGVLEVVNDALLDGSDPELFCTAAYLRLLHTGGRLSVEIASGGHPPVLLARQGAGTVERVGPAGTLLGAFSDLSLDDAALVLGPGDLLVAYTDGITEARRESEQFGETRLCELIASRSSEPVGSIARAVVTAAT